MGVIVGGGIGFAAAEVAGHVRTETVAHYNTSVDACASKLGMLAITAPKLFTKCVRFEDHFYYDGSQYTMPPQTEFYATVANYTEQDRDNKINVGVAKPVEDLVIVGGLIGAISSAIVEEIKDRRTPKEAILVGEFND